MNKEYTVALSFSGQDREFAEKLADTLKREGVAVFYDKYEQHDLWGKDLFEVLRDLYVHSCRHVVVILTRSYLERMWPVFERRQIIEKLASNHGQDAVLPVYLDGFRGEVPGLSKGIGSLSVSSRQVTFVVDSLLKKLGRPGYEIDSAQAYDNALRLLKDRDRGVIEFDRIYTSPELVSGDYETVTSSTVLDWLGNEFFWKRSPRQPLIIYGRNSSLEDTKELGLVEICRFDAPDPWIGCGWWTLFWLNLGDGKTKDCDSDEHPPFVLALYIHSPNVDDFSELVGGRETDGPFLAGLLLTGENAVRFYSRAESRFRSLR